MITVIRSVNALKRCMPHLPSKLQRHDLANFQNLASELEMQGELRVHLDSAGYTKQSLTNALLEPLVTFM